MFSVLMSLYHKESASNLKESLESIYNQLRLPDEVILVYDGYIPDGLNAVVESYKKLLPLKVIKIKDNVGLGEALNVGLSHCSNNIIARMDTDDICYPNRFEKQMSIIDSDENIAILGSSVIEFDSNGNENEKLLPLTSSEIRTFSKVKNPFNHMSVIFKKDIIQSVGGYKHHLFMEDYNLWLRVIAKGYKVCNLYEPLVLARVGTDMIKRRKGLVYVKSEYQLFKLKKNLKINGFFENIAVFAIRTLPRLMPVFMLRRIYKFDRAKSSGKSEE